MMVLFNTELISKIVILFFLCVNKYKGNTDRSNRMEWFLKGRVTVVGLLFCIILLIRSLFVFKVSLIAFLLIQLWIVYC